MAHQPIYAFRLWRNSSGLILNYALSATASTSYERASSLASSEIDRRPEASLKIITGSSPGRIPNDSLSNRTRLGRAGIAWRDWKRVRRGGRGLKGPFRGMKTYAKNQEVAACLPAAENQPSTSSSPGRAGKGRNIRHLTEKPKRRRRRRNCTWIYLFLPPVSVAPLSFFSFARRSRRSGMR